MFSTPEFWVLIAFLLLLGGIGKRAFVSLTKTLDDHRQKIAQQVEEAQRLHDEALSLLHSYKKKSQEAEKQAEQIISFAEAEAKEFKKTSEGDFKKFMVQKEKALLERLNIEKEETKSKLIQEATEKALSLVEQFLAKAPKEKKKLTHTALKEMRALPLNPTRSKKR